MAKGNPNDSSMKLDFIPRVRQSDGSYKPFYIAPDATSGVRGDVYLSDAIDGTADAALGVTAATPKAVNDVRILAENKIDKKTNTPQSIASTLTVAGKITATNGVKGNLEGNADTATTLATTRKFTIQGGKAGTPVTGSFNGSQDVVLTLNEIDAAAVNKGTLPLSVVPQAALERLVTVTNKAARLALTTSSVQKGDSVLQSDTGVMYIVVDDTKLNQDAGYQEYKAGTAAKAAEATTAGSATKATQDSTGQQINTTYIKGLSVNGQTVTYTKGDGSTGIITTQDTKPVNMTGATTSTAGKAGYAPAPSAGAANRFLRSDGTWAVVQSGVTGVKGNTETSYRTGDVNITPAHIGALALTGGTLTGGLAVRGQITSYHVLPAANNQYNLGSSSMKYANLYATTITATTINGTVSNATNATNATSASKLNKTLKLSGDVSGSVSLSVDSSEPTMTSTIGAGKVTTAKIADANVTEVKIAGSAVTTAKIADSAITTAKINNKAITNAKLADDVGTVYIGSTEPTEEHVKIWIKY